MKITKILLLSLIVLSFSCSKDDDPGKQSSLENASISLKDNTKVIEAPTAMLNANDTYAQMAASQVAAANVMSSYISLFTPPSGSTKSSTPITAVNGRAGAAQKEYLVYIWSDAQYGSIAYQISEESGKYVFELFVREVNETDWYKYIYAEEVKDGSKGLMKIYNPYDSGSDGILALYEWTRADDQFNFTMTDGSMKFVYKLSINQKTKAGSVQYIIDGKLSSEMVWNANGSGSWKQFDESGTIIDEGEWFV